MNEISVVELKKMFDENENFVLLDIRENEELQIAQVKPHNHIPMGQIPERIDELDKDDSYIVMCHSGMRSARVCQYLEGQGYNVKNLNGGIDSWSVNVDPTVPRY